MTYVREAHTKSIDTRLEFEVESAEAMREAASERARHDHLIEQRLNDIVEGIEGIKGRLESRVASQPGGPGGGDGPDAAFLPPPPPAPGSLEEALADGLERIAKVARARANASARAAAGKIREFMRDNGSGASEQDVTEAVRAISPEGIGSPADYADAVHRAAANAVLEPGRNLPHDMRALDEAHRILATAGAGADAQAGGSRGRTDAPATAGQSPAPALASTEVMRDVSHLTTLLLGSSPAFAEAMRMQSDALAHSLAALNKVGDMQRQDALSLAITAHAAVAQMDRR